MALLPSGKPGDKIDPKLQNQLDEQTRIIAALQNERSSMGEREWQLKAECDRIEALLEAERSRGRERDNEETMVWKEERQQLLAQQTLLIERLDTLGQQQQELQALWQKGLPPSAKHTNEWQPPSDLPPPRPPSSTKSGAATALPLSSSASDTLYPPVPPKERRVPSRWERDSPPPPLPPPPKGDVGMCSAHESPPPPIVPRSPSMPVILESSNADSSKSAYDIYIYKYWERGGREERGGGGFGLRLSYKTTECMGIVVYTFCCLCLCLCVFILLAISLSF